MVLHNRVKWKDILERIKHFADRSWYAPIVGALAALDQFIIFLPIEWLMVPSVLVRPRRWFSTALWVATGSALGSVGLAAATSVYGFAFLNAYLPSLLHSQGWIRATDFIESYGAWALFGFSVGPLPQQAGVAFAGITHMPMTQIFLAVWLGRSIKYLAINWVASHAPRLLKDQKYGLGP